MVIFIKDLFDFLKKMNLKIIIKSTEYIYLEGFIEECNSSYLKLKDISLGKVHIIKLANIKGIALATSEIKPGPCVFDKLPLKYPPYCWSCVDKPNSLIMELIRLKKTMPPEYIVGFSLNSFEQVEICLENIIEINSTFIFLCLAPSNAPNIKIPIALVCAQIDNMDLELRTEL